MKLLRISEDLVIAPELISHYTVEGPVAEAGEVRYLVMAHSLGAPFPLAAFNGFWKDEIEKDNRWGPEVARERAELELARIQALVEAL